MPPNSTLEDIIQGTGHAIHTIIEEIGNPVSEPQKTLYFLRKMGWNIPLDSDFSNAPLSFINNINTIEIDHPSDFIALIRSLNNVISDFDKIKDELGLDSSFSAFVNEFPRQLLDYALLSYFESEQPKVLSVMLFLGIADNSLSTVSSATRIPYKQYKIVWERLTTFLQSPDSIPQLVYGWGTGSFNDKLLIEHIEYLLNSFGVQTGFQELEHPKFKPSGESIYAAFFDTEAVSAGLEIYPIETDATAQNAGLAVSPFLFGSANEEIALHEFFKLLIDSTLRIDKTTGLIIRPKTGISLFDINNNSTINGSMRLTLRIGDTEGLLTLGSAGSTHLHIHAVGVSAFSTINIQTKEFGFEVGLQNSKIVIDLAGGDSFITSNIPLEPIEIPLDLTVGYSSIAGIYFKGSAGIEIKLPTHIALGPIEIGGITIGIKVENRKIPITTSMDFKAALGPLSVVVEDIGAFVNLNFPDNNKGDTGPFDLSFGFKPPNGLGLAINAGAVIGGGYLFFDLEKQEYAGALELTIAGFISAKAIGIITTKMPDGSKGFSMLIIITAEFFPPFQLGYGFTLNAVGGLLGLHRTVLLDPLRDGVRTGAINNIMFPTNVMANAPRIISDLKAIFPPYEGKFLIGPMAKIGWGTPSLITLSFGLIIEIPGNIAILGVLKLILPDERVPIVKIQVAFVGTIDFDRKMITFDASLFESSMLQTMTLEGDMALRLAWGDQPNFIMTVGGFHPSFIPPPLALPTLRRLAINILNTSISRIRVECYQAVTSNTVQFGARAEIFFDLSACSIDGHIGFDALFQFNPFYFIIELSAGFNLKAVGVSLMSVRVRMSLEGPTPWHAKGTGKVSLLFFDISANFDKSWGESKTTTLPSIEILPLFLAQVQKKEHWNTVLSMGKNLSVSLRKFDPATENVLVLHPTGSLVLQQKLLPLAVNIDKIGNQKAADVKQLTIDSAASAGTLLSIKEVKENFARAQYQNLSDAEKLSKPSFEKMQGGVAISAGDNTIQNGKIVRRKLEYELTIIDKEPVRPLLGKFFREFGSMFSHLLNGNSVAKSKLSQNTFKKLQPFEQKLGVEQERFSVAFQSNNQAFGPATSFDSEQEAQSFMQDQIRTNPSLKTQIHIVPQFELQAS